MVFRALTRAPWVQSGNHRQSSSGHRWLTAGKLVEPGEVREESPASEDVLTGPCLALNAGNLPLEEGVVLFGAGCPSGEVRLPEGCHWACACPHRRLP